MGKKIMRVSQYIVIAAVAVLLFSCDKTMDKSEEGSLPVGKTDQDIISAVQYAYSLEGELWEHEQSIEEKEDVVTLFRKGFAGRRTVLFAARDRPEKRCDSKESPTDLHRD